MDTTARRIMANSGSLRSGSEKNLHIKLSKEAINLLNLSTGLNNYNLNRLYWS